MASLPYKGLCSYCQTETTPLRNGWEFRNGGFAKLCEPCASAYENGTFCSKFHSDSDGWRDCIICGKMIHCGCIVSYHMYETLDFGGVSCTGCAVQSTALVANQYSFFTNATLEFSRGSRDSLEAELPVDSGKMLFGVRLSSDSSIQHVLPNVQSPADQVGEQNQSSLNGTETITDPSVGKQTSLASVLFGPPSQSPPPAACHGDQNKNSLNGAGTPVDSCLGNPASLQSVVPGLPSQLQSPAALFGQQKTNSLNEAQTPVSPFVGDQISQGRPSAKVTSPPLSLSEITDNKLSKTSGDSNSVLVLLFEKFLSVTDADPKLARLVLPKLCAEFYFPFTSEGQRHPINVRDISGKDWTFYFRVWRSGRSRNYVLEGVKKYMDAMDWKVGDKVAFYRMGSEEKYVIETKKVSSDSGTA